MIVDNEIARLIGLLDAPSTEVAEDALQPPLPPEGMAFDENCRLYATVRAEGRVERWLWAVRDNDRPEPVDVLVSPQPGALGDFSPRPANQPAMEPVAKLDEPISKIGPV